MQRDLESALFQAEVLEELVHCPTRTSTVVFSCVCADGIDTMEAGTRRALAMPAHVVVCAYLILREAVVWRDLLSRERHRRRRR